MQGITATPCALLSSGACFELGKLFHTRSVLAVGIRSAVAPPEATSDLTVLSTLAESIAAMTIEPRAPWLDSVRARMQGTAAPEAAAVTLAPTVVAVQTNKRPPPKVAFGAPVKPVPSVASAAAVAGGVSTAKS